VSPAVNISALTFLESFAAVLVQRAIYFYTKDRLGFSDAANLWLALIAGVTYVAGAMSSHAVSRRVGERRLLLSVLTVQLLLTVVLAAWPRPAVLFAGVGLLGVVLGLKWPVVESYASAGLPPATAAGAVGRFNFCWASSIPVSLAVAGPLIAWRSWALFAVAGGVNVVCFGLLARLRPRPAHLPADHPERPDPARVARLTCLQTAARWIMLASYAGMWILGALMPGVLGRLGFRARTATALWGLTDAARLATFVLLGLWTGWHERRGGLVRAMILLPAGFALMLFAPNLPVVLAGELLFGWAAGEAYYAALYYAMVAQNASVAAGGGHESLIGLGFVLGPLAGLGGVALKPLLSDERVGVLAAAGVLILACSLQASRALLRTEARSDRG